MVGRAQGSADLIASTMRSGCLIDELPQIVITNIPEAALSIVVRYPKFDFAALPRRWARNRAFAYDRMATSLIPAPVEPWLIRICQKAVNHLGPKDAKLVEDINQLIGQEAQHFRQHRLFNQAVRQMGYPGLASLEHDLAEDLREFEENRSMKFLLAYAAGFEAVGAISAQLWFDEFGQFLEEADPHSVALWGWHLAEEFEHRAVIFNLYRALYGRGVWNSVINGYFYRLYGLVFVMRHLGRHTGRFIGYMVDQDRPRMSVEDRTALKRDLKEWSSKNSKLLIPKLASNLLPWYDPARMRAPKGLAGYLKRFEPGGDMARAQSGERPGLQL